MPLNIKSEPGQPQRVPQIKPEPRDFSIPTRVENSLLRSSKIDVKPVVKQESKKHVPQGINSGSPQSELPHIDDIDMKDAPKPALSGPRLCDMFTLHGSAGVINYQPENALKEGLGMVKAIQVDINKLELGSKLRKEVWLREIESLRSQGAPTTMIAVCGATGAGKSSILNAILDDNIVPTSGMRACTAVVTEIGYHSKKTIDADVSFLSENEWRDELTVLLEDLIDEDGNVKRSTDLRSDAGPCSISFNLAGPLGPHVDQIITRDPKIAAILGTTKHITTPDSRSFGKEIAKYIDSKDQKRGDKKNKTKEKQKEKENEQQSRGQSLLAKFKKDHAKKKDKDDDPDGPAFWPLIRQVNVRCNAPALSTGALLVDLPGVADANAARNNIAKDYMKKCDCIWILAPITRAVDDKTARDLMGDAFKMQLMNGNYDANSITFIATKCDDISCSEVIRALTLDDEPELEVTEAEIYECKCETAEWAKKKAQAASSAKDIEGQLKHIREVIREHEAHIEALEHGDTFTPVLTGKPKKSKGGEKPGSSMGKKRKRAHSVDKPPAKRRRGGSDDDDFIDDDSDFSDLSDSDSEIEKSEDQDYDSSEKSEESESQSDEESDDDENSEDSEEITIESLKVKVDEAKEAIKVGRAQLNEFRKLKKEASDKVASLQKRESKAQREKNAFCSLKRSEFSRDVLKEDFRVGLKDLDDAAAEQRDPDSFDPTVNIRDYDAIDLPVFTCSARDYVRIKGQVKGDGDPTCFTNVVDTGIPELQKWCHSLTVSSRERAARAFLTHLKTFATSVRAYVEGIGDVTEMDRQALREKWESSLLDEDEDEDDPMAYDGGWASSDIDLGGLSLDGFGGSIFGTGLYTIPRKAPKVDRYGELVGTTPRLIKDFKAVVTKCVQELQGRFRDGLEEKCRVGAVNASAAAVETSDNFAASMHWATYRATLRRDGSWRQDLNVELSNPFTRNIASSWSHVFEADLFGVFEKATNEVIEKLLKEVENDAPAGLKERARGQGELSLEEAKVALKKTLGVVKDTLTTEQKEISRCLAPHVQTQLREGYILAMEERGRGSVARQKAVFHNYVNRVKDVAFDDAAEVILGRLSKAAEAVGNALEEALAELAEKVEVSIAVLWEGPRDDPRQLETRMEIIADMTQILEQAQFWTQASEMRRAASTAPSS